MARSKHRRDHVAETLRRGKLYATYRRPPRAPSVPNLTVALTTFPERIKHAELVILQLREQTMYPERVVLVLAEDEIGQGFRLPRRLAWLVRRGRLTILVTSERFRSYGKLLPAISEFSGSDTISIDDDVWYEPEMVEQLVRAGRRVPNTIIGNMGRRIVRTNAGPEAAPYVEWPLVDLAESSSDVLLLGVGGVLYPSVVSGAPEFQNYRLAAELTPMNDDIWFWAAAEYHGVPRLCLGNNNVVQSIRFVGQTRALSTHNRAGANDRQLAAVQQWLGSSNRDTDGSMAGA